MINVIDEILSEVSLDERIKDGIFNLDEALHMDALREFLAKTVTISEAIQITNRMLEGKYPERQAYNADGILVTFPTPKHKAEAIKRGTHFEKSPNPTPEPKQEEPSEKPLPPLGGNSTPSSKETPTDDSNKEPNIFQGQQALQAEPIQKPETNVQPVPIVSTLASPEKKEANKDLIQQIINAPNTSPTVTIPTINETCRKELAQLYITADKLNLKEAVSFLTPYIKA